MNYGLQSKINEAQHSYLSQVGNNMISNTSISNNANAYQQLFLANYSSKKPTSQNMNQQPNQNQNSQLFYQQSFNPNNQNSIYLPPPANMFGQYQLVLNNSTFSKITSNPSLQRINQPYQGDNLCKQPQVTTTPMQRYTPYTKEESKQVQQKAKPIKPSLQLSYQSIPQKSDSNICRYPQRQLHLEQDYQNREQVISQWILEPPQIKLPNIINVQNYHQTLRKIPQKAIAKNPKPTIKAKKQVETEEADDDDEDEDDEDDEDEDDYDDDEEEEDKVDGKTMNIQKVITIPSFLQRSQGQPLTRTNESRGSKGTVKKIQSIKVLKYEPTQYSRYSNNAQRRNKIFFIRFTFIVLYFLAIRKIIMAKKQKTYMTIAENINTAFEQGTEWALTFLDGFLHKFWSSKELYDFNQERLSEKEQALRIRRCMAFISTLLELMNDFTKQSNFEPELVNFLGQITQNNQFPPQNYLFKFELNRIQLTSFGSLKNMNKDRQKMMIVNFLLIRVILFTVLYSPWNLGIESVGQSDTLTENCIIITSILHELILSEFRQSCPEVKDNQKHLQLEERIQPRSSGPLKDELDSQNPEVRRKQRELMEPLIFPVYNRKELKLIFDKEPNWIESTLDKLDDFYDKIVLIVLTGYKQEQGKRKYRITQKMKNQKMIDKK